MSFYRRHVLPSLVHLAMRQKQLVPCTIPDARRALTEIRRVLKPGGALPPGAGTGG